MLSYWEQIYSDKFYWGNIYEYLDGRWKCNHCKEVFEEGEDSRILNHFSGEGNNVRFCEAAPSHIQQYALKLSALLRAKDSSAEKDHEAVNAVETSSGGQGNDIRSYEAVPSQIQQQASNMNSLKRARSSSAEDEEDNEGVNVVEKASSSDDLSAQRGNEYVNAVEREEAPVQVASSSDGLSQGNHIRSCQAVASHVIQQALKMNSSKRARPSSGEEEDNVVEKALSSDDLSAQRGNEYVTDALVKFLVSIDASVNVFKNSHFRTLLTRVAEKGFPTCLLRDDSVQIQRSVWNLEHEVNEYLLEVKESWKITGCTMMLYKMDGTGSKGKLSSFDGKNNFVFGFYCPKGFFFVEGRQLAHSHGIRDALKNHVLNLPSDDVLQVIDHSFCSYDGHPRPCELNGEVPCDTWSDDLREECYVPHSICVQQEIQQLCRKFCKESEWVQNLFKKSEKLYEYILDTFYVDLELGRAEIVDGMHSCSFSRFRSVMDSEEKLKTWLSDLSKCKRLSLERESDIPSIINDNEFWCDGRMLIEALSRLFKIADLVDTLVPTAGYLRLAIDEAKLFMDSPSQTVQQGFGKWLENYDSSTRYIIQASASYMCPAYRMSKVEENLELTEKLLWFLKQIVGKEEHEALNAELEVYSIRSKNPFANLVDSEWVNNHPVKLWNKYGGEFPVLKKCAIKLLSQPVSCMCKQVKKHMSQIQGADNFVLRLNYRMMEEFKKLGDGIYEPIDFS